MLMTFFVKFKIILILLKLPGIPYPSHFPITPNLIIRWSDLHNVLHSSYVALTC